MIPFRYILSFMMLLRCFYESLSVLETNKLLHLVIELMNSFSEKGTQGEDVLLGNSFKISASIWWSWAILNDKCRVCQRSLISRYSQLLYLYLTASTAGSLHLLIQFISSQGPLHLLEISWILRLKNVHFMFLIIFLNCFQFSIHLDALYLSRFLLQFMFHQLLECFIMLTTFKFFTQMFSIKLANSRTMLSRWSTSNILLSIFLIASINYLTKVCSSLLYLTIVCFLVWIYSLTIG